ncbi:MAG: valine--tRNA ligase [Zetaproteobacteria bacterium CG2_30_46_52]|nr:MAG: valine--tRNA ligase [Zetaproteobacteria bacterium CG2_30_46_52]
MTKPVSTAYEPQSMEPAITEQWLNSDAFKPNDAAESYSITLPPPNVTGSLHMGHAFSGTIQDILIRWQRMLGKSVLWQLGLDHAGIATQMVVERQLDAQGVHRRDLGREKFIEKVWEWKAESGGTILGQMKHLGFSIDWSRERFTMDETSSNAVKEVFVRLFEEGLIYRGKRLVNWDPVLETAVSDLEVVHEEEAGHFWHIQYPYADDPSQHIVVATTRPETLLGDGAVAVHPDDERYKDLIGKELILPLCGRTIPVVADTYVDPEFGTGCVKITPAHDFNDYEVGKRHDLPMRNIFTNTAHINNEDFIPEQYVGLDRYEARERIIADLDAEGLLYKTEEHLHKVGRGDRSHAIIEPYLTDQWYVAIQDLADPAIKAVEDGDIRFVPQHWEKTYFEWMRNINDWCISRQLWWGHQIPAWYCADCEHITVSRTTPDCCDGCGSKAIKQDEDVLDTWFSSGLWPFSTLDWPANSAEMDKFYSTNVLVTGFDIIFFWVARMIMMGQKFTDKVPFKDVYIHALIRDKDGQKMSKSKGNVVDPLQMIDLYGADALRFTLAHMATPGRDVKLDVKRIESNRNFMNKIWNASRFVFMNRGDAKPDTNIQPNNDVNAWILHELNQTAQEVEKALQEYRFNEAAGALYNFIWGTYCDWYVEAAKVSLYKGDEASKEETQIVMLTALDGWLRLLHPICPFITESLFQELHGEEARLVTADWKASFPSNQAASNRMQLVMNTVNAIRSIRGEMNVSPSKKIEAHIALDDALKAELEGHEAVLKSLAKLESIAWVAADTEVENAAIAPLAQLKVYLPLAGLVDVAEELARIEKAMEKANKEVDGLKGRLGNDKFVASAPEVVVSKAKADLAELEAKLAELEASKLKLQAIA